VKQVEASRSGDEVRNLAKKPQTKLAVTKIKGVLFLLKEKIFKNPEKKPPPQK